MGSEKRGDSSLLDFYDRMSSVLDQRNESVECMFLECQKASETVPRSRLVKMLDFQTDIRGRPLQWIKNYFSGRKHGTHVRGSFSKWRVAGLGHRADAFLDLC